MSFPYEKGELYKTVDGIDYFLWNENNEIVFWAIIDNKRIVSPLFIDNYYSVEDIWDGNYTIPKYDGLKVVGKERAKPIPELFTNPPHN